MTTRSVTTDAYHSIYNNQWSTALCQCWCADSGICCRSAICPCVQYGRNQEQLQPGSYRSSCLKYFMALACTVVFLPSGHICCCCDMVHGKQRREMRARYEIRSPRHCVRCVDCLTVSCCSCCTLAQEALQLQMVPLPPPVQKMSM